MPEGSNNSDFEPLQRSKSPDLLASLLAPQGPVAEALGTLFEHRPQQSTMCREVAKTMNQRSHLLAEAGTGVGKSFAYLLPAALRCVLHGETVVVATHTISLQEQLIEKDIPIIQRVLEVLSQRGHMPSPATEDGLPRELKPVLVKGRGNYVSIRRLALASERQEKLLADPAARRSLHVIEDWAYDTTDGTLSSLPPLEKMGVWDKVQSDSGNCMGRKCPNHEKCFYQAARAKMAAGNLLVCNHSLFFSDLAMRAQEIGFLPKYDHVILDEAHSVEEVAAEHFGASITEGRVQHLLTTLYQPRTNKGYLAQLALQIADGSSTDRAVSLAMRAQDITRIFFDDLLQFSQRKAQATGTNNNRAASWIARGTNDRAEPTTTRVREPGVIENALSPAMADLALRLRALRDETKVEADKFELNAYAQRCEMVAAEAKTLVDQLLPACAYWIETTPGDEGGNSRGFAGRRVTFACAPIEVGPILKDKLFATGTSVILTSATIATAQCRAGPAQHASADGTKPPYPAFAHAKKQLGCDGAATLQLGSPFDYAKQVRVYVSAPTERADDHEQSGQSRAEHEPFGFSRTEPKNPRNFSRGPSPRALADAILPHLRATDGGAFILFTSFGSLHAVARELSPHLARLNMPMLVQGKDGSRTAILQRFREDERSVLLGAASFWQGVDVRGRGLRNVIITKLPFDPPDRPLVQARSELIESRGGSPFMDDSLPRAILRFKQGFGRLVRSSKDEGRVVVLDDRVLTARYGRLFLQALPEGVRVLTHGSEERTAQSSER